MRLCGTALATLAEWANLMWEHFHGGIVSHHILDRADLPAISNGWSGLLIPVLVWFLIGRIQARLAHRSDAKPDTSRFLGSVVAGFMLSLFFGILITVCFTSGYEAVLSFVFPGMILLGVFLPGYRAECVLGFVLGMMFTFGAVLPAAIGGMIALVSAAMHFGVYPVLVRLWSWLRRS